MGTVANRLQGFYQIFKVMTIDGANIVEFKCFKEHAGGKKAFKTLLALSEDIENIFPDIRYLQFFDQVGFYSADGFAGELTA